MTKLAALRNYSFSADFHRECSVMLTEPWAILLSGLSTLVGALIIALLGPWLLGRRFQTLDDAATAAKTAAEGVEAQTRVLDAQVASLEGALARVQNIVNDLADELEQARLARNGGIEAAPLNAPVPQRETIRRAWDDIRERIENLASSTEVDGRTRAKYSRMDRRKYRQLLEAMDRDGILGNGRDQFFEALEIWSRYRANRAPVAQEDVERIEQIRASLQNMNRG